MSVHFLLHSDYAHVSQHSLKIESTEGNFDLPQANAYQNVAQMLRCNVVAIALKTTQNHLLPQLLPNVIKDDGIVLVWQNGLEVEAIFGHPLRIAQAAGADLPRIYTLYQQLKFLDAKNCA